MVGALGSLSDVWWRAHVGGLALALALHDMDGMGMDGRDVWV